VIGLGLVGALVTIVIAAARLPDHHGGDQSLRLRRPS
jgi:hypothetical protein